MKLSLLLAALAVAGVLAGPHRRHHHKRRAIEQDEQKCAHHCSGTSTKYSFEVGRTYSYQFTSHTDVEIPSLESDEHTSNITQKSIIEISKLEDCEYQMLVRKIDIIGQTEMPKNFERKVTEHALRFAFDDGTLSTVCADSSDETWVVNLKRGILSTLQNAFQADEMDVHETEVNGKCRSRYSHRQHGDDTVYTRRRHSCHQQHSNMHGAVKTHAYETDSSILSNNDAQSHHCEHRLDAAGVLKEARCIETQKFTPMTDYADKMIQTTVRSHWRLQSQEKSGNVQPISFGERKSIVYDPESISVAFEQVGAKDVKEALQTLCASSNEFVAKSTPSEFVKLVETLRRLNDADWSEIDEHRRQMAECENGMKFMRDALAMCGSQRCLQEMVQLLKSGDLSETEEYQFFASLAFVPKVTLPMVKSLMPLVQNEKHGLLGVTSMVHTYCVQNEERRCDEEETIQQMVESIVDRIGRRCELQALNAKEMEEKILAIKALGNIGQLPDSALSTIEKCINHRSNPISARVAAAQSLRRAPCSSPARRYLRQIFADDDEEVELRIASFLSLMKCADEETVTFVVDQLQQERVQQVGSFVASYLQERQRSNDPHLRPVAELLKSIDIPTRYNQKDERFSYYSEMGSFNANGNTGSHIERGVIYVPGSFTPRAAYANLTAHLFGHSVNFFELGARAEGLDHFIDNQFGTEGLFTNPGSEFEKEDRETSADYLEQQKEFEKRTHYESDEKFALSMYVRVFGDEILYMGIDDPTILDSLRKQQDFNSFKEFLAKQRQFTFKQNALFMDITKALPNAGGLPVYLKVTGASSMNMKIDGKTDLTEALSKEKNVDIEWTLKPSMAIELSTTLYIDVAGVRSGMRLLTRVHSSTAVTAALKVDNGKLLKTSLGLPQDSQKIVDFELTGLSILNNQEKSMVNEETYYKQDEYCTPDRVNRLLGVRSCMGLSTPTEGRIFPARAWMGIDKTDQKLETYQLEIKLREGRGIPYPREIAFDTPGSEIDRKLSLSYNQENEKHIFEFRTPAKKMRLEGDIDTRRVAGGKSHHGKMNLIVDDQQEYKMLAEVKRVYTEDKMVTSLHAKTENEDKPIEVDGKMEFASFSDVSLSAKVQGLAEQPTEAQLSLKIPKTGRTGDAMFEAIYNSPEYNNKLEAKYANNYPNYGLKLIGEVKPGAVSNFDPMTTRFDVEHREKSSGARIEIERRFELVKSIHPQSNFMVNSREIRSDEHQKYGFDVKYGKDLTNEASAVVEAHYEPNGKKIYQGKINVPQMKLENKIKAVYENKASQNGFDIEANAEITDLMGNNKKTIEFRHKTNMATPITWLVDVNANVDNSDMVLRFYKELTEKAESNRVQKQFTTKSIVQWAPSKKIEFNGDVSMTIAEVSYDKMHYDLTGKAKLTGIELNGEDEFDVVKSIKHTNGHYQYKAKLTHKDKPYYDLDMDLNNKENQKTFKSNLKSYMSENFDYGVDVKMETPENKDYMFESTVIKSGKNYAQLKAKCLGPKTDNSQHRLHLLWDMDTQQKEALFDLKKDNDSKTLKYLSIVEAKLSETQHKLTGNFEMQKNEQSNYKLTLQHDQNGKKVTGCQIAQDNGDKSMLYMAKYQSENEPKSDIELKFATDMNAKDQNRDWTTSLSMDAEFKDNLEKSNNVLAQIKSAHRFENSKLDFFQLINIDAFDIYQFKQEANLKNLHMDLYNEKSNAEYQYDLLVRWDKDKAIERKILSKRQAEKRKSSITYEDSMTTPFDGYRQASTKIAYIIDETDNERTKTSLTADLTFNNERVIKATSNNEYESSYDGLKLVNHQSNAQTKWERLGDIKIGYQNDKTEKDGLTSYNLDGSIQWASTNKLHFRREYGSKSDKARYLALWSAKVGEAIDSKARYDYQLTDTQHRIDASMKHSDDQYQLIGQFDDSTKEGTVKIVAPNTPLETLAIKVERVAENEYKLSTEAERGARVSGVVKLHQTHMRAQLKIEGVETPVEIQAEMRDDQEAIGKLVIIKNFDSEALAQKMGVHYHCSLNTNYEDAEQNRGVMNMHSIIIHTSKRESHFELRHGAAGKTKHYAIVTQLDRLSDRAPTKILARIGETKNELELIDPSLKQPVIVSINRQQKNECPLFLNNEERCQTSSISFEFLPPSAKSSSDRLKINLVAVRLNQEREIFAIESQQLANDYQQVYYVELSKYQTLIRSPQPIIAPSVVEVGAQILREKNLHKYAVHVKVPTPEQQAELSLISPAGRQSIEYNHIDDEYRWTLRGTEKNQASYTIAMKKEDDRAVLELRRTPTSDVLYHASAGLIDEKTFEEETYHVDQATQKKYQDTFIKIWLEKDNLLKARLHVPPASWKHMLHEIKNVDWQSAYNTDAGLIADWSHSQRRLVDALTQVQPEMEKMLQSWNRQKEQLREEIGATVDLMDVVNDVVQYIVDAYHMRFEQMRQFVDEVQKNSHVMRSVEKMTYKMHQSIQSTIESIGAVFQQISRSITDALHATGEQLSAITSSITDSELMNDIRDKWNQFIEDFKYQFGMTEKEGFFARNFEAVKEKLGYSQKYTSYLMQFASVRRLYATIEPTIDEITSIDVQSMIERLVDYIEEMTSGKNIKQYLPKVNYASKEQGQIEFAIPLPVRVSSLKSLANKIVSVDEAQKMISDIQTQMSEIFKTDGKISEEKWKRTGTKLSPSQINANYEKSHKATAYLVGQQMVTFDGRTYGISTACEYILARDFYKNKFAISAALDSQKGVQKITLKYKGKHVTVTIDGKFKVNGEEMKLPYQYVDEFTANAYIKALRLDRSILISTYDGIEIECDQEICRVALPGQYYGHSNGLLGSNDLEPSNDFDLRDDRDNEDVALFADQWLIHGGSCRAKILSSNVEQAQSDRCEQAFRYRRSPLRQCFNRVAPKAFHQLCVNGNFCSATKAYQQACNEQEIDIQMPSECVRCENPSSSGAQQLTSGDSVDLSSISDKKADIVYVVEERSCMKFLSEQIFDEAMPVEQGDNRFGVVGFGGEQVHNAPHFHACDSSESIQCTKSSVKAAIDSLEFEPKSATYQDQPIDPLSAVDYTVRHYPWRPASAKIVVLFACTECGSEVDYYRLQTEMLSQNVQLYVYTKQLIEIEEQQENLEIIGLSAQTLYTNRGEKKELRSQLTGPHDSCTVLAQELNGTVFSLYDGESSAVKRSGVINLDRIQYPTCQICACEENTAPQCNCVSCAVPQPVSLGADSAFFNIPYVRLRDTLKKTQEQLGGVPTLLI